MKKHHKQGVSFNEQKTSELFSLPTTTMQGAPIGGTLQGVLSDSQ